MKKVKTNNQLKQTTDTNIIEYEDKYGDIHMLDNIDKLLCINFWQRNT